VLCHVSFQSIGLLVTPAPLLTWRSDQSIRPQRDTHQARRSRDGPMDSWGGRGADSKLGVHFVQAVAVSSMRSAL
jgi:hypothetical protein